MGHLLEAGRGWALPRGHAKLPHAEGAARKTRAAGTSSDRAAVKLCGSCRNGDGAGSERGSRCKEKVQVCARQIPQVCARQIPQVCARQIPQVRARRIPQVCARQIPQTTRRERDGSNRERTGRNRSLPPSPGGRGEAAGGHPADQPLRWRILARIRRFFCPNLRRPLPVFLTPMLFSRW